ncbi:hypothetical protein LTR62_008059 [Meristemomyces frigidus]|uniref:Endonuclease/exonuclease/phosphatase domain-containing protein n=1 Tax=Meristemomyces frigidus TaxID=1508187 RepID=A0AAN7TPX5_9PEZI|nr:hypothetical protein LTR62_008059 [Meristemomyces frigidus]
MPAPISPPPPKRRKIAHDGIQHKPTTADPILLQIYCHNINGAAPYLQPPINQYFAPAHPRESRTPPKASLRDFLRRHDWPTILFLQEIKINPDDVATIRGLERAVASPISTTKEPDYVTHLCLPSDPRNARGFGRKVYGVASIIRRDFYERYVDRIRPVSWDKEGRFLVIETRAEGALPKLAMINVYAVNGTEAPYRDSDTGAVVGTRHDRKLLVHKLLADECCALQADGYAVIIGGDINVARSALDGYPRLRIFPEQHCINRVDFERRFFDSPQQHAQQSNNELDFTQAQVGTGLGMIDSFRFLHPQKRGYTYYPRMKNFGDSCDRVDMIVTSASLKTQLKEAGMLETAAERGPSDHVPLYAVFEFEAELEKQCEGPTTDVESVLDERPVRGTEPRARSPSV